VASEDRAQPFEYVARRRAQQMSGNAERRHPGTLDLGETHERIETSVTFVPASMVGGIAPLGLHACEDEQVRFVEHASACLEKTRQQLVILGGSDGVLHPLHCR